MYRYPIKTYKLPYRRALERLDSAMKSGFDISAFWLAYWIMDDRLGSVCRVAGVRRKLGLLAKLDQIRELKKENPTLAEVFDDNLLSTVNNWTEEIFRLYRHLARGFYLREPIGRAGPLGQELAKMICKKVIGFKRKVSHARNARGRRR